MGPSLGKTMQSAQLMHHTSLVSMLIKAQSPLMKAELMLHTLKVLKEHIIPEPLAPLDE